jgi:hypothetical protein
VCLLPCCFFPENLVHRNWICSLLLAVSLFAIAQQSMKMPLNMSGEATTFLEEVEQGMVRLEGSGFRRK